MDTQDKLNSLLQEALRLEHAAQLQYHSHAAILRGLTSIPISALFSDSASDESKHAETLRDIISNHLDFYPTTDIAETHKATDTSRCISINIEDELTAIKQYEKILKFLSDNKSEIDSYFKIEREIRLILIEELEHVAELNALKD
jgi:bacterioferritin (cytochrome b1)